MLLLRRHPRFQRWTGHFSTRVSLFFTPLLHLSESPAYRLDLQTEQISHLGQHADAISCMNWSHTESELPDHLSLLAHLEHTMSWPMQTPSSLARGTGRCGSGIRAHKTTKHPRTTSPNAFTTWTSRRATFSSSRWPAVSSTYTTSVRWTPSRRPGRAA